MPKSSRREGLIDWKKSEAKAVLVKDLMDEVLPLEENEVSAKEAWTSCYINLREFANVEFEQFKRQLAAHRKQIKAKKQAANTQESAFQHDRQLYPERHAYSNGRRIFRMSPAQSLLEDDIKNKRHRGMKPSAFRATRPEFTEWELDIFRQRIYQEERRQKFINYLNWKRQEKKNAESNDEDTEALLAPKRRRAT